VGLLVGGESEECVSVATGRCHSVICTQRGDLYSWGLGQ